MNRPCSWTATSILTINDRISIRMYSVHTLTWNEWFYLYCFTVESYLSSDKIAISKNNERKTDKIGEIFNSKSDYYQCESNCLSYSSSFFRFILFHRILFSIEKFLHTYKSKSRAISNWPASRPASQPLIPIQIIENTIKTIQFLMSISQSFRFDAILMINQNTLACDFPIDTLHPKVDKSG